MTPLFFTPVHAITVHSKTRLGKVLMFKLGICLVMFLGLFLAPNYALANNLDTSTSESGDICWDSFNKTRARVTGSNMQTVVIQSDAKGLTPYITLHATNEKGDNYNLWQTLNGEIRGYALKDGAGFDYTTSLSQISSLTWHPTLIWDSLLSSNRPLRNYACVLTGRTRLMGKRVSLLRLIPQEGLRYAYLLAKEDESDFPVELSILDNRGNVTMRLTVMESRVVLGSDFPIKDTVFEQLRQGKKVDPELLPNDAMTDISLSATGLHPNMNSGLTTSNPPLGEEAAKNSILNRQVEPESDAKAAMRASLAEITQPTKAATMTGGIPQQHLITDTEPPLEVWSELSIPNTFEIIAEEKFAEGGDNCMYQEFSDGLTSFRVYRNSASTVHFPILSNVTLTVLRKSNSKHEYTVVGELPLSLAEYILSKITQS